MNDVIEEIENLRTDIDDLKSLMLKRFKVIERYLSDIEDEVKRVRR